MGPIAFVVSGFISFLVGTALPLALIIAGGIGVATVIAMAN
jgi:hypothetical protein